MNDPADATLRQDTSELEVARRLSAAAPRVPGYRVERRLGHGTYGEVWEAIQKNTGVRVAIKFFSRHQGLDWPLLKREVDNLARLSNERRIVQLLHVGWEAEPPYYVMEYLAGGSLAERLEKEGSLPVGEAVGLFRDVARALVYLHGRAILHCDLKPSNVLLDDSGQVRLADFGQARLVDEAQPAFGTLFYMEPEQVDRRAIADVRADIYSLGALLYAMLTGHPPYASDDTSRELVSSPTPSKRLERYGELVRSAERPSTHRHLPGVDGALAEIVDRCLDRDPARRFENVQQILDALAARERRRAQRPLLVLGLLGPLVLLLTVAGVGFWLEKQAKADAGEALMRQTLQSLLNAAKVVAAAVDYNLEAVQRRVEREAGDPELRGWLRDVATMPRGARRPPPEIQAHADALYQKYKDRHFYSWFVADRDAVVWARAPYDPSVIGRRYAYREWFSGVDPRYRGDAGDDRELPAKPRREVGLTLAYISTAEGHPVLVGVASPIFSPAGDEIVGVLAATLSLGTFNEWLAEAEGEALEDGCPERFAILLNRGQVVHHPCSIGDQALPVPREGFYDTAELQRLLRHDLLGDPAGAVFRDPLRGGEAYLAGFSRFQETAAGGWLVLVQQNRSRAVRPVDELAERFRRFAWIAVALGLTVVVSFWFLLFRAMRSPVMSRRLVG